VGRGFISLAENFGITNGNGAPVVAGGPVRRYQYKRCPGSAEAAAADGSNVLSQGEQNRLNCKDSDRSVGSVP
jgi:hypothetical protein